MSLCQGNLYLHYNIAWANMAFLFFPSPFSFILFLSVTEGETFGIETRIRIGVGVGTWW